MFSTLSSLWRAETGAVPISYGCASHVCVCVYNEVCVFYVGHTI
jgi:hypothetical protein